MIFRNFAVARVRDIFYRFFNNFVICNEYNFCRIFLLIGILFTKYIYIGKDITNYYFQKIINNKIILIINNNNK